jgi:hypothetical protein
MSDTADIVLTPSPDLARPLTILPATTIEQIQAIIRGVASLKIDSIEGYNKVAESVNNLQKSKTLVKKICMEKAKPFDAEADRIRGVGKPIIAACESAINAISPQMVAYKREQLEDALTQPASSKALPSPVLTSPAAGIRERTVVESLECDIALLPLTYHVVDEVKIKKHILDGTITKDTPGVKFTLATKIGGTGR